METKVEYYVCMCFFSLHLVLVFYFNYVIAELAVHATHPAADAPIVPPETGSDRLTLDSHHKDHFVGWY